MTSQALVRQIKKRRDRSESGDVPVDKKLCDLDDLILCRVLSFLPTTGEVVRTSILSKRWKNLWTYVDTLVFKNSKRAPEKMQFSQFVKRAPQKMQFSQFVDRVLLSHTGPIKTLQLSGQGEGVNRYDIENWINYANDQDAEILLITFNHFRLPFGLLHSETLVDLDLGVVDITKNILTAPFFPSLKKLKLSIGEFDHESLQLLISGCLVLKDLDIKLTDYDELSLILSSSTLKRLVVNCVNQFYDGPTYNRKIEFYVPALEYLSVCCPPTELLVKDQLFSLTEVFIYIFEEAEGVNDDICRHSIVRLMELISNVKILRLECDLEKPLPSAKNAKFPNLTKLEIWSSCFEWYLLGSLMESSINLEFLSVSQVSVDKRTLVFWVDPQNVPHCLLPSLLKISITGPHSADVLNMVDYVLRNAVNLERMDIKRTGYANYEEQCRILKKLLMIKRASRTCEVSVV